MKATTKLWIGLAALVVLSPLGLILPAKLGAGSAWGEWSGDQMQRLVGYVPAGMSRLAGLWKAPMPDYALKGQGNAPLRVLSMSYILSAVFGVAVVVGVAILLGKALARRERTDPS
jgi:hypothetical protein